MEMCTSNLGGSMFRVRFILLLLFLILVSVPSFAHADSSTPVYMCGIDVDPDGKNIPAGPAPWTLRVIFADKETRAYLSGVEFTLFDKDGKQLAMDLCDGAWIVLALKPGEYKFQATYQDKPEERVISVGEKMRTEYYFW